MDSLQALRQMLDGSGVTSYRAALEIGRNDSYVSGMLRRGSVPSADLLAKIARACGYSLRLVPDDGGAALVIDGGAAAPAPPADG